MTEDCDDKVEAQTERRWYTLSLMIIIINVIAIIANNIAMKSLQYRSMGTVCIPSMAAHHFEAVVGNHFPLRDKRIQVTLKIFIETAHHRDDIVGKISGRFTYFAMVFGNTGIKMQNLLQFLFRVLN